MDHQSPLAFHMEDVHGRPTKTSPTLHEFRERLRLESVRMEARLVNATGAGILYGGRIENWHEGNHLADAASRAGLDLAELDGAIERDAERFEALIGANQDAQRQAGHWGVPTFAFKVEPFFGQDRIDALLWRLGQHGLKPRA